MIELKLLVDEVNYDSLVETLLPLVQDKLRDSGGDAGLCAVRQPGDGRGHGAAGAAGHEPG